MKIPISPRTMITITLLGATFSTANVMAMRQRSSTSLSRAKLSLSDTAPQQPRKLSELEKFVQKQTQTVQHDIAQQVWKDPQRVTSLTKNINQRAEIKNIAQEIKKKQQELCACLKEVNQEIQKISLELQGTDRTIQEVNQMFQKNKLLITQKLNAANALIDRYTVNVHDENSPDHETPLIYALIISAGNPSLPSPSERTQPDDLVMKLLNAGADPNLAMQRNVTPLMFAALSGSIPDVKLLLAKKANPDALDDKQQTALHYATQSPAEVSEELIQELFQASINPFQKNGKGLTAVEMAQGSIKNIIIKKMIEKTTSQNAEQHMEDVLQALAEISKEEQGLIGSYRTKIKEVKPDLSTTFDDVYLKTRAIYNLKNGIDSIKMSTRALERSGYETTSEPNFNCLIDLVVPEILAIENLSIKNSAEKALRTIIESDDATKGFIDYLNKTIEEQTELAASAIKVIRQLKNADDGESLRQIIHAIYKCPKKVQAGLFFLYKEILSFFGKKEPEISSTIEVFKAIDDAAQKLAELYPLTIEEKRKGYEDLSPSSDTTEQTKIELITKMLETIKAQPDSIRKIALQSFDAIIKYYQEQYDHGRELYELANERRKAIIGEGFSQSEKDPQ